MRLLIITYTYFPDLTPRAFRWKAVAEQLQMRGHTVHVLCAAPGLNGAGDGITVHRVSDRFLKGSVRSAIGSAKLPLVGSGVTVLLIKDGLRQVARALWRFFYWPDFACGWVVSAAIAVRALHTRERFDWIISSSHPFSGHLVALLARASGAPARWFVDISDPYYLMREPSPYNRLLYSWLSRWVEGRVLKSADAISVTTDSTAEIYEAAFPGIRSKTRVIGPLLSLPTFPPRVRKPDGALRLVYVGTLYRKLRSPKYLLACFAELKAALPERHMEMHFYGTVNDCAADLADVPVGIAPFVVMHGLVSRETVLQAMVDADVLVNIGNHSEAQLASKVIEYMAVGRPILNLVSIAQDASEAALADYPAALTLRRELDWERRGLRSESLAVLVGFLNDLPMVSEAHMLAVRARYAPKQVGSQYIEMLEGTWRQP